MLKKKGVFYSALAAWLLAFVAQALWESPFQRVVWHLTYVGGWCAWKLVKPVAGNNASVWAFDLIAIVVNGVLYFLLVRMCVYLGRILRPPTIAGKRNESAVPKMT